MGATIVLKTYHGSCHCGAIRFEADIDLNVGTSRCNCSYCAKVRAWKAFVQPVAFRLVAGEERASPYHRDKQAPLKFHCPTCGVHTHERGDADYMAGPFVGVFIATLDDTTPEELAATPVRYSDGANNNWQNSPANTGYL
jgi:hypothetical protein